MRPVVVLVVVLLALAGLYFSVRYFTDTQDKPSTVTPAVGQPDAETKPVPPEQISTPRNDASAGDRTESLVETADGQLTDAVLRANVLVGQVLSGVDLRPVANAEVRLSRDAMMGEAIANQWFINQKPSGRSWVEHTDSSGTYRFANVEPARDYFVMATHPEFAPIQEALISVGDEGEARAPDIVMMPGSSLSGYVYDVASNPIQGATLWLDSAYMMGEDTQSPDRLQVQTDNVGFFDFKNVASGPRNVTVTAAGFGMKSEHNLMFKGQPNDRQTKEYKLEPGHPIAGRVVASGAGTPIGGARIQAFNFNNNTSCRGETTSAQDGSFTIEGLQQGSYLITCEYPCHRAQRMNRVMVGDMNVQIDMLPRGKVSGFVVDGSGQSLSNFTCSIRRVSPSQGGGPKLFENTNQEQVVEASANGAFELCDFDPGTYVIEVRAQGFASAFSEDFTVSDQNPVAPLTIRMSAGGSIRGRLVDSKGTPIRGATISSHDASFGEEVLDPMIGSLLASVATERKTRSDAEGNYELKQLAAADYLIVIQHPNFTREFVPNIRVIDGQSSEAGTLTLKAGGALRGKVFDPAGQPVPRGYIHVISTSNPSLNFDTRTDAEGRYLLPHLPPGTYQVSATRTVPGSGGGDPFEQIAQQQMSQVAVSVVEGQETTRDLSLGGGN